MKMNMQKQYDEMNRLAGVKSYHQISAPKVGMEKAKSKNSAAGMTAGELAAIIDKIVSAKLKAFMAGGGPSSTLYETADPNDQDIYVYTDKDGADPVGKRCVYADATGKPTETNVTDGAHKLKDGSKMTTSTHDDGLSYVDSLHGEGVLHDPAPPAVPGTPPPTQRRQRVIAQRKKQINSEYKTKRFSNETAKKNYPGSWYDR